MVAEVENGLSVRSAKSVCVDKFEGDSLLVRSLLSIRHDKPCHKIQDSLFSSSSGYVDCKGIIFFTMLVLVLSNTHLALESIKKYGMLYDPVELSKELFNKTTSSTPIIILGLNVFALSSLGIEVLLSKGFLSENVGRIIITTLLTSEVLIPATAVYLTDSHVFAAGLVSFMTMFFLMKLVSYHITNLWCRQTQASTQKVRQLRVSPGKIRDTENNYVKASLVQYPDNLNIKDLFYFIYTPTLCYELNFPRSAQIRRMFLFKRVLEMIILFQFYLFLMQQCLLPAYNEALKPFQEMDYLRILEKYIKFSVPYTSIFFITFYTLYHSCFNGIAEILRFGDRYFYGDFWNAKSITDFWEKWSVPIHKFSLRHIYVPLRQSGFSPFQTLTIFFFASAAFHEYLYSVPIKMLRFWSFPLMLSQVPYILFLDKYLSEKYASITVFAFFLVALPFYHFLYYYDYHMKNHQNTEAVM